ncbi:MAG: hypothetical protein WBN75_02355, partial [Verrucomicrobiia bacterium]
TTPAEPEPACEPENPVARSRRKSHLPNVQKSKFEKLALFSTSLGVKSFQPEFRSHVTGENSDPSLAGSEWECATKYANFKTRPVYRSVYVASL